VGFTSLTKYEFDRLYVLSQRVSDESIDRADFVRGRENTLELSLVGKLYAYLCLTNIG
jgi:hypothetical protein